MPAIQTTFVDLTSIVPAEWFNRLQKHLAGFLNLKVDVALTLDRVRILASDSDGVASAYIGGEMRRNDTTTSHIFAAESSGTYNVYVVATAAVDTFGVEVSLTTPATSPYRKVAEVDWDLTAGDITALRGVRARVEEHSHDGAYHDQIEHSDLLDPTTGDPHTQYVLPNATRPFTGTVGGVSPTETAQLTTKSYADSVLRTVPIAGVFYWPSNEAVPAGFLLAGGSAVSRTTYAKLFAKIGTTFGTGDGSTTFNLPDMRGRMAKGYETGSGDIGDASGALVHNHTQAGHTHKQNAHTHTTVAHTHNGATTGSSGSHTHTQGSSGSSPTHTHTAAAHTHSDGTMAVGNSTGSTLEARHAGTGDSGLFTLSDLDSYSSSTSHGHGDGGLITCDPSVLISGTSGYNSASHNHSPAQYAAVHTHAAGSVSGTSASGGGSGTGNNSVSHTHTNPTTASSGAHTHASGGSTGSASPGALSGGNVETGAGVGDDTGDATHPYVTVRAIIRYE